MNDQISRKKLIKEIYKVIMHIETACVDDEYFKGRVHGLEHAVALAFFQPPASQWIPCDIAVPPEPVGEYYKDVQIKRRSGEVVIGYYRNDDGEWWEIKGDDADRMLDAVEWRPLPEPYKGVE